MSEKTDNIKKEFSALFGELDKSLEFELDDFIKLNFDRICHHPLTIDFKNLLNPSSNKKESKIIIKPKNVEESFAFAMEQLLPFPVLGFAKFPYEKPSTAKQWMETNEFLNSEDYSPLREIVNSTVTLGQILSFHPGFSFQLGDITNLKFKIGDIISYNVKKEITKDGIDFCAHLGKPNQSRGYINSKLADIHWLEDFSALYMIKDKRRLYNIKLETRLEHMLEESGKIEEQIKRKDMDFNPENHHESSPLRITLTLLNLKLYKEVDKNIRLLKKGKKIDNATIQIKSDLPNFDYDQTNSEIDILYNEDNYLFKLQKSFQSTSLLYLQSKNTGKYDESQTHFRRLEELYPMIIPDNNSIKHRKSIMILETFLFYEREFLKKKFDYKGPEVKYTYVKDEPLLNNDFDFF